MRSSGTSFMPTLILVIVGKTVQNDLYFDYNCYAQAQ